MDMDTCKLLVLAQTIVWIDSCRILFNLDVIIGNGHYTRVRKSGVLKCLQRNSVLMLPLDRIAETTGHFE